MKLVYHGMDIYICKPESAQVPTVLFHEWDKKGVLEPRHPNGIMRNGCGIHIWYKLHGTKILNFLKLVFSLLSFQSSQS
jgi:hypothetical protein